MSRQKRPGRAPLRAYAERGTPREPHALRRYLDDLKAGRVSSETFPYWRYNLDIQLACPRLQSAEDRRAGHDGHELQVCRFYRGTLPWLMVEAVEGAARQRWIDFIGFVDELIDREDDMFAARSPWPLADLRTIVAEALALLQGHHNPFDPHEWPQHMHETLQAEFAALDAVLAAHEDCCAELSVNVHWW